MAARLGGTAQRDYILVIDDEPDIVELLVALLHEDEGFPVHTANSMGQLLAHAPTEPPGLILLDATLPGESVDELAPSLRHLPGWGETPIVICSGQDRLREIAERVGAATYLSKPFSLDSVVALAHQYIPSLARNCSPHLP
jgi:CheY-like chemotaxis protein